MVINCLLLLGWATSGYAQRASLELDVAAPMQAKVGATIGYAVLPELSFRFYYQRRLKEERALRGLFSSSEATDRGSMYEFEMAYTFNGAGDVVPRVGLSVVNVRRKLFSATSCAFLSTCQTSDVAVSQSALYAGPSGGVTFLLIPKLSVDFSAGYAWGPREPSRESPISNLSTVSIHESNRAWVRLSAGIALSTRSKARESEFPGRQ